MSLIGPLKLTTSLLKTVKFSRLVVSEGGDWISVWGKRCCPLKILWPLPFGHSGRNWGSTFHRLFLRAMEFRREVQKSHPLTRDFSLSTAFFTFQSICRPSFLSRRDMLRRVK